MSSEGEKGKSVHVQKGRKVREMKVEREPATCFDTNCRSIAKNRSKTHFKVKGNRSAFSFRRASKNNCQDRFVTGQKIQPYPPRNLEFFPICENTTLFPRKIDLS